MKRIYIFLLFAIICTINLYGQTNLTGINTTAPQQQLHVAGTTSSTQIGSTGVFLVKPTIRIDGLNNTNNSTLYTSSPSQIQSVSVTQNGDLILSADYPIPVVATSLGTDEITSLVTLNAPGTNGGNNPSIEGALKTYTFTLTRTSMVHFLASVSVSVYNTAGATLIDGTDRAYHAVFKFTAAPAGVAINVNFGQDGSSYVNSTNLGGVSGNMYVQPESYMVLPPGNYTLQLTGRIFGNDYAFRAIFGQGSADMVSIIATPL